jgi:hypothetical protein
MMYKSKSPVGRHIGEANAALDDGRVIKSSTEGCVGKLHTGKHNDLGKNGESEEWSVLHNDTFAFISLGSIVLADKGIDGLAINIAKKSWPPSQPPPPA